MHLPALLLKRKVEMKTVLKGLQIPLLSVLLAGLLASFLLPLVPIDETRYVSVAWEMWNSDSYAVPLLNGEPYCSRPRSLSGTR
jgi:4-amino-4-deoxy-L-arabinose transferase-like glycosyltransferase